MPWKIRMFNQLMDKAGDPPPGGAGDPPAVTPATDIAALAKRLEALEKENAELRKPKPPEDDLSEKARKDREAKDKSAGSEKSLAAAIRFEMSAPDWLKTNESLLPKNIAGIFEQASKEVYANQIEKDSAIKSAIVLEFFAQQANADLLTDTQKVALEDFRKLTKTVKQERAQNIYDQIFEPTFEMLKRIKKAEQLQGGKSSPTDSESRYKEKLLSGSTKHYLGEKK